MAFKLTKGDIKQRDALIENLREAHSTLVDAISQFNGRMGELRETLEAAVEVYNDGREEALAVLEDARDAFNGLLADAQSFVAEVSGNAQSEFDERSEKWQEGERGQAAQSWIERWSEAEGELEAVDLDPGEPLDIQMCFPEELNEDIADPADQLEELPEEPEE